MPMQRDALWRTWSYLGAIVAPFWMTPDGVWKDKKDMPKAQKLLRIRVDEDDYAFLSRLATEERENLSQTVRDLVGKGRLMLAIEAYRAGKASLGKAAEIAGLSISETIDLLARYGVPANLEYEDYLQSLKNAQEVW